MNNSLIGKKFTVGNTEYILDEVHKFEPTLTALILNLKTEGKDPAMYFASKVLASGKPSNQGGMFYRFTESGNFIKVL